MIPRVKIPSKIFSVSGLNCLKRLLERENLFGSGPSDFQDVQ